MKDILVVTVLLLAPLASLLRADEFIVESGQPPAEIVIAEKPARMTKLAAKELQSYVAKMSGAPVPVVTERSAGKVAILCSIQGIDNRGLTQINSNPPVRM